MPEPVEHVSRSNDGADQKEARRQALVDAALEVFARDGFSRTKIEDIAAEAGMGKGTVYLYYESKTALFQDMLRRKILPIVNEVESLRAGHQGSAVDLLKLQVQTFYQGILKNDRRDLIRLVLSEGDQFPEIRTIYAETVINRARGVIIETLKRGQETGEFRDIPVDLAPHSILGGVLATSAWRFFMEPDEMSRLEDLAETHLNIVLHGIMADPKSMG